MSADRLSNVAQKYDPSNDPVFVNAPERLQLRYDCYFAHADDGKGDDLSNNGQPLKTFSEWLST
jgi:hypothetical protein